jgi:hypothetical protein
MRKQISKAIYLLFAILVIASISFSSCKKEKTIPVVTTALADSITTATTLLNNSVEGVAAGQYQRGSKAALQTTITAVQTILNDATSTQTDINNAVANLSAAITLFKSKAIVPIAQANLVAQWTFSEGTGTTVTDASSNHLVGTFMEGHAVVHGRGPLPTWCPDRYGVANKALHFSYGGHLEVPYTSILAPTQMSISLWFQVDSLNLGDNYMISEDWWDGYKLNLQTATKPFFTFNNGTNIYDRDWDANGITDHNWHHLVVTLTAGIETYYGDGALIHSWTDVTGGISIQHTQTFTIGQAQPNTIVNVLPADDPSQWGVGYFRGSMDEIRIYNIALTATQVTSIYNAEKP